MDFGLDNEFESDDSFFDDPKISKKTQPPKTTEKKSLEDIFGFENEKKVEKSGQSSLENVQDSPVIKPKVRFNIEETPTDEKTPHKPIESSKTKDLDWLGGSDELDFLKKDSSTVKPNPKTDILGDAPSKGPSKIDSKKSFDLLDDILPQRGRKTDQAKTTSFEDILRDSKAQKSGPVRLERTTGDRGEQKSGPGSLEIAGPTRHDTQKTTATGNPRNTTSTEQVSMILEPPQGPRRGRRGSNAGVTDVLGLFGSGPSSSEFLGGPKASNVEDRRTSSKSLEKDIPDWLGGSSTTVNKSDTTISSLHKSEYSEPEQRQNPVEQELRMDVPSVVTSTNLPKKQNVSEKQEPEHVPISLQVPHQQQLNNTFQTNMSNLQAQESFLLVSLQLKKYEENLSEIKNQQQEILKKQESQFDLFLNKYIEKQKNIEQGMLSQQERINDHIRMMSLRGFEGGEKQFINEEHKERIINKTENEEKTDDKVNVLEKIVQSLKQRHDEEFFLMEESYKKQIALIEKSTDQVEQRLNEEVGNIAKTYEDKLKSLQTQHTEELKHWTEKIKDIDEKHREEIDNIRENHSRVIREVKDEFLDQIERFREQRTRENELFSNGADFSQKLNFSLEKLGKSEDLLEQIQEKVVSDYSVLSIARERSIENKEKEITAMRIALEKCRDQAEKDRSQLFALVKTLEHKISEQNQNAQEERWALQQAAATIAARSSAFDREVEFSRASIERERDQLKTLKEALLAEQERTTMQLTEEKLKLSAEKSRLEVSAKLVNNYEVQKIKTEAETAIKVAKELTEKLNLERSFVQRQKLELESFRNKLMEKERDLLEREENVEDMRRTIQQKNNEDRRVIQETKYLENRYKEKISELQSQAISLSNREKKLAEEKLLVSKERLALYTSMKSQNGQKKCMLCKAEEDKPYTKTEALFVGYTTTDPEFVRLRMEAMEDERNSEVSREDNSLNTSHNK